MKKLLSAVLTVSVIGGVLTLFFEDFGANQTLSTEALTPQSMAMIDARILNEEMYQSPFESKGIDIIGSSSLSGTDVDNSFELDADQNLLATTGLKDMFEYYLATLGEYDLEQVIASVQNNIKSELAEPARSQALDLLKRYIDYKIGIAELKEDFDVVTDEDAMIDLLVDQQSEIKAYRQTYFSLDEYEAFFEREDIQNSFLIEQLRISRDTSLSAGEKKLMLAQAEQSLPEDIRQTRKRAQQHVILGEKVREMQMNKASEAEIFLVREELLGSEAAAGLAELDRQREQWAERLAQFSNERSRVMESSLSDEDKNQSVAQLLAYHFNDTERKRVSALMSDGRL